MSERRINTSTTLSHEPENKPSQPVEEYPKPPDRYLAYFKRNTYGMLCAFQGCRHLLRDLNCAGHYLDGSCTESINLDIKRYDEGHGPITVVDEQIRYETSYPKGARIIHRGYEYVYRPPEFKKAGDNRVYEKPTFNDD